MAQGRVRACWQLHEGLLCNVLRSPTHFFDVTPLGRVLNRFSKDVDVIDVLIPVTMTAFVQTSISLVTTLGVIGYSTPVVLTCLVPVGIVYVLVQVQQPPSVQGVLARSKA